MNQVKNNNVSIESNSSEQHLPKNNVSSDIKDTYESNNNMKDNSRNNNSSSNNNNIKENIRSNGLHDDPKKRFSVIESTTNHSGKELIKDRRISSRFDVNIRKTPSTKIPIINSRDLSSDVNKNDNDDDDDKCNLDHHKQQSNGNGVILKSEPSTPTQKQQPTIEQEPKQQQQQQQKTKLGSKFFDLKPKTKVQV